MISFVSFLGLNEDLAPDPIDKALATVLVHARRSLAEGKVLVADPPWGMASNTLGAWKGSVKQIESTVLPLLERTVSQAAVDEGYKMKWLATAASAQEQMEWLTTESKLQGLKNNYKEAVQVAIRTAVRVAVQITGEVVKVAADVGGQAVGAGLLQLFKNPVLLIGLGATGLFLWLTRRK